MSGMHHSKWEMPSPGWSSTGQLPPLGGFGDQAAPSVSSPASCRAPTPGPEQYPRWTDRTMAAPPPHCGIASIQCLWATNPPYPSKTVPVDHLWTVTTPLETMPLGGFCSACSRGRLSPAGQGCRTRGGTPTEEPSKGLRQRTGQEKGGANRAAAKAPPQNRSIGYGRERNITRTAFATIAEVALPSRHA